MPDYSESGEAPEPLTGQEVRKLYAELKGQFSARNQRFSDNGKVRDGEHWDGVNLVAQRDRYSLTANYVGKTAEKSVEGWVGIMPAIQVIPTGADEEPRRIAEACEGVLYGTWHSNRMDILLRKVADNVVVKSAGYIYMWFDHSAKRVRYRNVPPENYFPVMDGDDVVECIVVSTRLTRELKRAYPSLASKIASDGERDEVISDDPARGGGSSFSYGVTASDDPAGAASDGLANTTKVIDWFDRHGNWVRVMGEAVHSQKLDYGIDRVPVYEFLNVVKGDGSQARSEIDDVIELNRYYDQLLSQNADIIAKYSDPPVINEETGQTAVDIQRAIRAKGGVIPVRKGGVVKYLNWEGTMPEIGGQMDRVKEAMHDLSGKPPSAYGQTVTNQSGVVTNLALTPTVAQTTSRETLMGATLQELNADTLRLYEKFCPSDDLKFKGRRAGRTPYQSATFDVSIKGREIGGWYENRIKWPSAYRVDDPVYVQNKVALMQQDPPALSIYDGLEELGYDDVEGRIDRIAAQLEDPRFHPDRLSEAIGAVGGLADTELPTDLEGFGGGAYDAEGMNEAAEAMGSPDRSALVAGA